MEKNSLLKCFDSEGLRMWFFRNRRLLPWRDNPSPYQVWISEVMLQQTQVAVVIPYYQRWMKKFPSIQALAQESLENVIKQWEGLGYYSRARNLHEGAQYLMKVHGGRLPDNYEELCKIKGLGPYTIGAILSFAYGQKMPAVDGNVLRVLTRLFAIEDPIDKSKTQKEIGEICAKILPDHEPWVVMEALIELGATVCQKKAKCAVCPLSTCCLGKSKADLLPIKTRKQEIVTLHRKVAVILAGKECLVKKGKQGQVMADLWEFPYFDHEENIEEKLNLSLEHMHSLKEVKHGFTKYRACLSPSLYYAKKGEVAGYQWIPFSELVQLPFSSGHRKILGVLRNKRDLFMQ